MQRTVFDNSRKGSTGSFAGNGPRVKSSLLGTSARQKLLKYKLEAHHANAGAANKDASAQIVGQIDDLNKVTTGPGDVTDHLKNLNVSMKERGASKKTQKERILEQVYRVQKPGGRQSH